MRRPRTIVTHAGRLRLQAERLGVRTRAVGCGDPCGPEPELTLQCESDDLSPGLRRRGGVEIEIERSGQGEGAAFQLTVRNISDRELYLESALVGFRLEGCGSGGLRFLRHGWQSWSFTGACDLDPDGSNPDLPPGPWLRGIHHARGRPPPDRIGWHESHVVSVIDGGGAGACLAGALETGRSFGLVYLRQLQGRGSGGEAGDRALAIEVELLLEVPLAPGENRRLEAVRVGLGPEPNRLLEAFAELWGRAAGARARAPFKAVWCSWYQFFHRVTERDLLRNLDALAAARDEIPVDVVQLDDGFQRAVGDWLETNPKFPRGLAPMAEAIAAAGFTPGLWTAPFCAAPESHLSAEHEDWLLQNEGGRVRAARNPEWTTSGWVYALDTAREEVRAHLRRLYRELVQMGFGYFKLDFLYAAALAGEAQERRLTRAERLRLGLGAVRAGAGDRAFLLGCGCPLGPAVGMVDAMRIGPDVAPAWEPAGSSGASGGGDPTAPALKNALRSILHRAWMHRRLWMNDPDCLIARTRDTGLSPEEVRSLAGAIATSGGLVAISDDVPQLGEESRELIRETLALARRVDEAGAQGVCRAAGLLEPGSPRTLVARWGLDAALALFNPGDAPSRVRIDLSELGLGTPGVAPETLLGTRPGLELSPSRAVSPAEVNNPGGGARAPVLEGELRAHEAALVQLRGARKLAVFCDFDGTFSRQDVGATLVVRYRFALHPENWARYRRGEITAWEYNCAVIDGLELPRRELDAFLESIQLDPGSGALVSWCRQRGIPFRILSDGFDYNLERLQQIHGIQFDYASNRLRYEGDTWRISAGHPNPDCHCGTGSCKRGIISAYRRENPGALCVHIGNGRVSDLCGALAADLIFAKDSLALALEECGEVYFPFETLYEVRAELERLGHARL